MSVEFPAMFMVEFNLANCYDLLATLNRAKQLKLEGLILKLRARDLPFWMLR